MTRTALIDLLDVELPDLTGAKRDELAAKIAALVAKHNKRRKARK